MPPIDLHNTTPSSCTSENKCLLNVQEKKKKLAGPPVRRTVKILPRKVPQLSNEDQGSVPRSCFTQPEVKRGGGWGEEQKEALTLYPVFLHFLDLGDGLPQVICKLLAVLGVGRVKVDEDFDVRTWYR